MDTRTGVHLLALSVLLSPCAHAAAVHAPVLRPVLPGAALPSVLGAAPALTPALGALAVPVLPSLNSALPPAAVPKAHPAAAAAASAQAGAQAAVFPVLQEAVARADQGLPQVEVARALFDGSAVPTAAVAANNDLPPLPASFRIADARQEEGLRAILAEAERSATGRRILSRARGLARRTKRPIVFEFAKLGSEHAYVDWGTDVVRLGNSMLKDDPRRAAPILIHELSHVLQKERRLPFHAFELELEAFLLTIRSARELGVKFKRGDFQASVMRRFEGDLDKFIAWLNASYGESNNIALLSGSRLEFLEKLTEKQVRSLRAVDAARKRLKERQATYKTMRAARQRPEALERYRRQELDKARERLRDAEADLKFVERDISILSSAAGYARYRRFADDVRAMARRLHGD